MTSPSGNAAAAATQARSAAPAYRSRWWWIPATVLAVVVISALQVSAEVTWLSGSPIEGVDHILSSFLVAHVIAGVVGIALFGTVRFARSGHTSTLPYSERYLVGVVYGLVVSLLMCVAAAALVANSAGQAVEYAGTLMSEALASLEMPVACIVGGLVWFLVTKVRDGETPQRPRREIEDPE